MANESSESTRADPGTSNTAAERRYLVVRPDNEESYWQPVPANGFASVHVAPHLAAMQRAFSVGTQTVPPGGYVRLHAHADAEEVFHIVHGYGKAIIEGVEHRLEPGTTIFLGARQSHTLINDGTADLHWVWFFVPSGLEKFFKAVGHPRRPGETAPAAFARPDDVLEIEASTGFTPVSKPGG
ncbi:cupin domain-containing protein [Trinickia violacea]|uniref:Cupin domain-containing protein n=1 Tax=Trinickia violacea TaxID=2571746 RepID=A0A4P8IMU3_9BURK|nr:cupin domain-containing protein [Trinickia violacea]QCP50302.1 cupin domain-containing protein [Trinickia violacea]